LIPGSLIGLAKLPSCTIQLMTENAFKALKYNQLSPKYGIIYQHESLTAHADVKEKGKVSEPFRTTTTATQQSLPSRFQTARRLAGKIALAARVDAFRERGSQAGQQAPTTMP
jgi:RNA processing factor Prp31